MNARDNRTDIPTVKTQKGKKAMQKKERPESPSSEQTRRSSHCSGASKHVMLGRGEQGEFLIYIDGHLRGKYATAEMMHVHFADCLAECDRLRANQRGESAKQIAERHGIEVKPHDPIEGLLGG